MENRYDPSPRGSGKPARVRRVEMDDPQRLERLAAHEAEIRRMLAPDKPKRERIGIIRQ